MLTLQKKKWRSKNVKNSTKTLIRQMKAQTKKIYFLTRKDKTWMIQAIQQVFLYQMKIV